MRDDARGRDPLDAPPCDLEDSQRRRPGRDTHARLSRRGARLDRQRARIFGCKPGAQSIPKASRSSLRAATSKIRARMRWRPGTRIEVRQLFFNTPARLKFLKTLATEQGAIAEAFQRVALANHHVAFKLNADGRTVFELPRAASALERVRQIFGTKLATKMLPFDLDRPGIRARGLVATSQESFATGRMIYTFVNGRAVRDRMLMRAIDAGLPDADPARTPSGGSFVRRHAPRGRRRQRPSDENRSAVSQRRRSFRSRAITRSANASPTRLIARR